MTGRLIARIQVGLVADVAGGAPPSVEDVVVRQEPGGELSLSGVPAAVTHYGRRLRPIFCVGKRDELTGLVEPDPAATIMEVVRWIAGAEGVEIVSVERSHANFDAAVAKREAWLAGQTENRRGAGDGKGEG